MPRPLLWTAWAVEARCHLIITQVQYVDVGVWIHDMVCHERGEEKRGKVGLYRPPTSSSIITHNLKKGGFAAAWGLMQPSRLKVVSTSSNVSAPSALESARLSDPKQRSGGSEASEASEEAVVRPAQSEPSPLSRQAAQHELRRCTVQGGLAARAQLRPERPQGPGVRQEAAEGARPPWCLWPRPQDGGRVRSVERSESQCEMPRWPRLWVWVRAY